MGYLTWRGIAHSVGSRLPEHEALMVLARGAQAVAFHCGADDVYWFLTRNTPRGSQCDAQDARSDILAQIADWRVGFRVFVEATADDAILCNEVLQLANPIAAWLCDAINSTDLGQKMTDRLFTRLLCVELPNLD
ncbi:MAG: hypothetical protein ACJ8AH_04220 [Stellaceae bacterium]